MRADRALTMDYIRQLIQVPAEVIRFREEPYHPGPETGHA